VRDFLNRYEGNGVTFGEKAVGLARFFRWLKVVKGSDLSPSQFLNLHLEKRSANSVKERRWALKLALEYSRDNPDLKGKAYLSDRIFSFFFLLLRQLYPQ
jgi:hypothetical protein